MPQNLWTEGLRSRGGTEFDEKGLLLAIENPLQGWLDHVFGGKINTQWIDVLLVFIELEMEVRPGSSAGRAYVADDLAFRNRCACSNTVCKSIEVPISGRIGRVMLNIDRLAIAAVPSGCGYNPVANGAHRCSALSGEVYAGMRHVNFQDRIEPGVAEVRSDARKLERKAKERTGEASSFQVVVIAHALLFFEVNRGECLSRIDQFGGQDSKCRFRILPFSASLFEQDLDAVALVNVLFQVEIPVKYVRQLGENLGLDAGFAPILEKGVF